MKAFKILSLSLLLYTNAFASNSEISRRPLGAPEDPAVSMQSEDRVTSLEREVQALLGRVEVLEHTVSQLRSSQAATSQTRGVSETSREEGVDAIIPTPNPSITPSKQVDIQVSALSETKSYDAALLALKDNKYDDAERKFADFIATYTKSDKLSNAYFWYGETFYRRNNFEKAAINYLKGYKQFPKSTKAADSLLKLALSLGSMGKTKEACGMLNKLEAEFKDRPANSIKRARDARNKYGCSK